MALVTPISQVHASTVLLLLTVGNYNAQGWDGLLRQNIHATFHEHWPSGSKIETHSINLACLFTLLIKEQQAPNS
jgi:hypothetical protein